MGLLDSEQGKRRLLSVEIPIIERPGHLLIRVSGHFYNTAEEIDHLASVWREVHAGVAV